MNTGFYKDLDTNFEQACELAEQELSHDELLILLKNGNIPEKQIAALKLNSIKSQNDAEILISNLTGCDGKIREAVALKINYIIKENENYKFFSKYPDIFADATIDINGNICRLVIESVEILKKDTDFSEKYLKKIFNFIVETYKELDTFIFRDKKYVINKQLFKLYWCLESLKIFVNDIEPTQLYNLLIRAVQEKEYTIREKVAQIAILSDNSIFNTLKDSLKNDENYYVREVFS